MIIERRIDLLQKENQELKKTLENIGLENKQLKDYIDLVKKRCVSCDSLDTSEDDITEEKVEMSFIQDMGKFETDSDSEMINRRDKEPVARIISPTASTPVSAVAFYSYMSSNSVESLPTHHTLIYNVVHNNRGNGYSKVDGIFTAPVSGTYAFHFSLCIEDNNAWVSLEVVANGKAIGAVYAYGSPSGWHEGSNLVITDVNAGDHVFVRTHEAVHGGIYSSTRGRTSFSGWLLYQ
ncbi:uncharacterized protein LOC125683755 [Ostrea edulis]|uniref:uncharacterized protein LOC125683755 n=1 Tax=Ostrea edulis TaxID=37623 RepID=UPI0024AF9AD9|nr:uncharacterized protein LOC125683755 [Ostrea edulis]